MKLTLNGKQYAPKYHIIPVKLRSFYFKFIHRALPCNYTLYKMKITQTDYCTFCYNVPETLMYMFWECPYVQKLWKTIWDLVSIFTAKNTDTKMCNIILCTHNKENQIYTLISTIVKAYILHANMHTKFLIMLNAGTKLSITKKLRD